MRRIAMRLVMVVVAVASSAAGQVVPADNCGSVWMAGINELPFVAAGTGAWTNDVNFLVDLGSVCLAGAGGTPSAQDGDMVFQMTLGEHHDVSCSFTSPEPFNTADWTFVLSTSCAAPLAVNEFVGFACRWGQVVPQLTSVGFNTADLGLDPGTYYLWLAAASCCPYWEIQCTGTLVGLVFEDGFESADTTLWSATIPSP